MAGSVILTPWWTSYFSFRPRRMAMVSSTEGSSTNTFWKRRSRAASFSTYLRYSSSVVAPTQCNSPRANAGFNILPASIAPSALPAPTMVCSSSINKMTWPSCLARSFKTAFRRSSNSPRNLAPAINAAISNANTCLPLMPSGTSPLTIRCARPSTIAVLPTPGSPMSTGLFLVRRCNTWIVRRISSSRPMTGSSLPCAARSVRLMVYLFRAWRWSSALASSTTSPPRIFSIAISTFFLMTPAFLSRSFKTPFSSQAASKNNSLEINLSLRFCASLSVKLSRRDNSLDIWTSPPDPLTVAIRASSISNSVRSICVLTLIWASNDLMLPPSWSSNAIIKWTGSINWWSFPKAILWASVRADWNLLVNLSIRIVFTF